MTNGWVPVASARSWPGTTTPPSPSGSSASPRDTTIPVTRSGTGGPATGRTDTVSPTPIPSRSAVRGCTAISPRRAAGRPATVSTGICPFRCSTDSSCSGPASSPKVTGTVVTTSSAATRRSATSSATSGSRASTIVRSTRQAVAPRGVDEPLQARLERHRGHDRHHGQPEPDHGRRRADATRGPGPRHASPIPASTAGQRPSGAWPPDGSGGTARRGRRRAPRPPPSSP